MKQYDSYKDSGVKWIGKIPSHWEVMQLKNTLCRMQDGTHGTFQRITSPYLLLSAKNVFEDGIHISESESSISKLDYHSIISNGFPAIGDIVICCVGTIGRCCIYRETQPLAFQRSVTFLRVKKQISNQFLLYQIRSNVFIIQLNTLAKTSAQSGVYMGDLASIKITLPPFFEQQAIALYLDKKCAEIDKAISTQQKRIELLRELRQNIITHAVTRGINPNAPLKDSGVEWIGMVPEHWEIRKLKYIAFLQSGDTISSENFTDEGFPVYGGNGFRGYTNNYNVDGEHVLIGRQGALCGNINYAKGQFFASEHAIVVYPYKKDENILWLGELLRVSDLNQYSLTAAQPGIAVSEIKRIYYPFPPEEERLRIGKKIAQTVQKIEPAITKANRQISLLQELKQSIITEVVTGKRKVC